MADLYGTNNDRSFSSSSSLESEDMSSFLQSFLNNSSTKDKYGQLLTSPPPPTGFPDSDHRFSDLSSFYSAEANQVNFPPRNDVAGFDLGCQVQKMAERRQNSIPPRSSKRTRAAEIHNLSEKRRRSRINEKLKALQTLVPNSNKTDKASMLDEAIEYLKQLQLKVQTLAMRNGFGLQPVYSLEEQEIQRGMGYNEGYKLANPGEGGLAFSQNQGFSIRRELDIPNHTGMLSLTNMMKLDTVFGSEVANENQYGFTNDLKSMKDIHRGNRPYKLPTDVPFSGKITSPGVSS